MDYYFTQMLAEICERSQVVLGRPLRCIIIVNPVAGGFIINSRWKKCIKALAKCREKVDANPKREIYKNVILDITRGRGAAGEITREFIDRAKKDPVPFYLIISAGGDGTHCEVMLSVYNNAPAEVRSNMAVLKLPMGTGNDGADGINMEEVLERLIKPVNIEFAPAVKLITAPGGSSSWKGQFLAFNILSVGMDAYVTHMTNMMKGTASGDFYKLWLDIATLFYERKYKIDFFDVKAFDDKNNEVVSLREKLLLLAMGASGHRSYGSHQKILPDERNVCAAKNMSLFRKMIIKSQVAKGTHAKNPEVILFNAHRLEFSGMHPILAQFDGETILLQPDDFPAVMELTEPVIPLLKLA